MRGAGEQRAQAVGANEAAVRLRIGPSCAIASAPAGATLEWRWLFCLVQAKTDSSGAKPVLIANDPDGLFAAISIAPPIKRKGEHGLIEGTLQGLVGASRTEWHERVDWSSWPRRARCAGRGLSVVMRRLLGF